jgi:hypothetical protein
MLPVFAAREWAFAKSPGAAHRGAVDGALPEDRKLVAIMPGGSYACLRSDGPVRPGPGPPA